MRKDRYRDERKAEGEGDIIIRFKFILLCFFHLLKEHQLKGRKRNGRRVRKREEDKREK